MQSLDLYKKRRFTLVKLNDGIEYKIPNEYTVEEVERLLELKKKEEDISEQFVEEGTPEADAKITLFWENLFAQLEIIFQSYQPKIDATYLKKHITNNEALEIVGFFQKYRALNLGTDKATDLEAKKKLKK